MAKDSQQGAIFWPWWELFSGTADVSAKRHSWMPPLCWWAWQRRASKCTPWSLRSQRRLR